MKVYLRNHQRLKVQLILVLLPFSLLFSACNSHETSQKVLPQDSTIQVYFNHREAFGIKYQDPYRKIARSGDNLEAVIVEAINEANSSIDLAVQELQLPEIALALAKKVEQGIRVRVVIEDNYSRSWSDFSDQEIAGLPSRERDRYQQYIQLVDINNDGNLSQKEIKSRDALTILKDAGIPIIDDTEDGSQGSGLMHHKFIVIDNNIVITGSANFTLSDIHGDYANPDTRGNVNNLIKITNSRLANLFTEEFNYMWGDGEGGSNDSQFGVGKPWRSPQTITWDNSKVTVQFSPTSKTLNWNDTTNGLIGETLNKASSSVDMALFVFSEQKLADILEKKHQQGVEIRGLIDPEFIFRDYSEALDMLGVALSKNCQDEEDNNPWNNPIKNVGIANLTRGDKLHDKVAIIDNKIIITGSQNWSNAANYNNDETVLIIENSTVATHFIQEFHRLYQNSTLGLSEKVKNKINSEKVKCN